MHDRYRTYNVYECALCGEPVGDADLLCSLCWRAWWPDKGGYDTCPKWMKDAIRHERRRRYAIDQMDKFNDCAVADRVGAELELYGEIITHR